MAKIELDTAVFDSLLKMDVGYMVSDLREVFAEEEEFKLFADVLKESLGEFLMDAYASSEENVTIESLFLRLKEIVNRRFDEA